MQVAGWKSIPVTRNPLSISHHVSLFHSTTISLAKWKSKWNCKDEGSAKQPSKSYIRYAVRQKRADAKRALKEFFLYGKSSKLHHQGEDLGWYTDKTSSTNSGRFKSHSSSSYGKGKHGGSKSWNYKHTFYVDDDYGPHERDFEAAFRGHRGFTWGSSPWKNCHFENSTSGFEWKDQFRWERTQRTWSESDVENDQTDIVSRTHRHTLGLAPTGLLTLNDVKCAFRASALKWHPDKHQGPSQAIAEEKFKLCVDAYNALCHALKSA